MERYCKKCKKKTTHKNRMCQECDWINNDRDERNILKSIIKR